MGIIVRLIRVNVILMFLAVSICVSGCMSGQSASDKRIVRYRPKVGDRIIVDGPGTNLVRKVLKRGDKVIIELLGTVDIQQPIKGEIDELGINLPHIGRVNIDGKTTFEAERLIEEKYIKGAYYTKINVLVMSQDEEYFMGGEVNKRGSFVLSGDRTLMQAITAAGDFTDFAKKTNVMISRGKGKEKQILFFNCERIEKGIDKDPLIKSGDIITVDKRIIW